MKPQDDYGELGERLALWESGRQRSCAQREQERNNYRDDTQTTTTTGTAAAAGATQRAGVRHGQVRQSRTVQAQRAPVNALVYHGKTGIEVWHLYTGHVITRVMPLKADDTYYHDINNDNYIESISIHVDDGGADAAPENVRPPAANDEETQEDHTPSPQSNCWGMVQTGIPVAEHDVYRANICEVKGLFRSLDLIRDFVRGSGATTPVGPAAEVARDGDDAAHRPTAKPARPPGKDDMGEEEDENGDEMEEEDAEYEMGTDVRVHTPERILPTVVQLHTHKARHLVQVDRYAVFMLPSGLVTCVDPSRQKVLWRTMVPYGLETQRSSSSGAATVLRHARPTDPTTAPRQRWRRLWGRMRDVREHDARVLPYPHLMPYSFTQLLPESDIEYVGRSRTAYERHEPYLLVFREGAMTVMDSRRGGVVSFAALREIPVGPVSVVDYNGDGVNDVVVVSKHYIYGLVGTPQVSSNTLAMLMMLMLALLLLLFVSREVAVRSSNGEAETALPSVVSHKRATTNTSFKRATD